MVRDSLASGLPLCSKGLKGENCPLTAPRAQWAVTQSLYCAGAEARPLLFPLSNPTSAEAPLQVSDDLCPSLESCLGPWGHKALPLMCVLDEPVGELTRAGIKAAATRPSFTVPHRDRQPLWPVLVPSQRQGDQWALLRSPSTEALGSPLRPLEGRRGRGPPPGGLDQPRQCPEVARLDRQAGGP